MLAVKFTTGQSSKQQFYYLVAVTFVFKHIPESSLD